jgi:hypothetical protein
MAKARAVITPEEGAELKRLYATLPVASRKAKVALLRGGMTSESFRKADQEVSGIVRRIKEILGLTGKHWMEI